MRIAVIISIGAALTMLTTVSGRANAQPVSRLLATTSAVNAIPRRARPRRKRLQTNWPKKGPELWYAGSKFQQPWLEQWLQDPKPIRPLKYNSLSEENPGDHPKLAAGDAASITEYLMSLTSADVEAGVIKPKKNPKGQADIRQKDALQRLPSIPGQEIQGWPLRSVPARRG